MSGEVKIAAIIVSGLLLVFGGLFASCNYQARLDAEAPQAPCHATVLRKRGHAMIVRLPTDELDGVEAYVVIERGGYHSGSISPESEGDPEEKPRRPIGFRKREPEPEPPATPDWLLI